MTRREQRELLRQADNEIKAAQQVAYLARKMLVTPRTIRNWIKADIVKANKGPTGRWRIPTSEVQRLTQQK